MKTESENNNNLENVLFPLVLGNDLHIFCDTKAKTFSKLCLVSKCYENITNTKNSKSGFVNEIRKQLFSYLCFLFC